MTKLNRGFLSNQGGCNSEINYLFWPVFEFILNFIPVHFICKFQKDPIKTEQVMLTTKSNRCFFSNRGLITLRSMIQSGCFFLNSSEISFMSTFQASFRKIRSKLNKLCWDKVKERLFQQSRVCHYKTNDLASFWTHQRFHPYLSYLHVAGRSNQNWTSYADDSQKKAFSVIKGM